MKETVYFGTYTLYFPRDLQGRFDTESSRASKFKTLQQNQVQTYLAFDQDQHLYTVGSHDGKGGIAAYKTDGSLLSCR